VTQFFGQDRGFVGNLRDPDGYFKGQRVYSGSVNLHLVYYGPLRSSGNKGRPADKNAIRNALSPQMLGQAIKHVPTVQFPLGGLTKVEVGARYFVPLITEDLKLVVDINALILSPQPPSGPMRDHGDVDGRTKTFIDALRVPKPDEVKKLPPSTDTVYCLLEDDRLIRNKIVRQGQLLAPFEDTKGVPLWEYRKEDSLLLVEVTVNAIEVTDRNKGFLGIG
jgi:hypothetical protein